ncbi:MAG: VapC toxin family PIN domain ribonuclease [Methylocystis sp.]|nr:MAG: VapC toxin family PIN domain ribonuclease [Methylocystis sp.]
MRFLLDTNVISELRKGRRAHPNVAAWAAEVDARDLATSVLVLAEIRRGVELKRLHDPLQAELLERWYKRMRDGLEDRILPIDEATAERWARLNVPDPLPLVDGLLAATAIEKELILVSRNRKDFGATGVRLLDPFGEN